MEIGKMTISQAMPYLKSIAKYHNLRLNRAKEFKSARLLLATLYYRN